MELISIAKGTEFLAVDKLSHECSPASVIYSQAEY